jgi:hypothetical protein
MSTANPNRPDPLSDQADNGDDGDLPDTLGPPLKDPRSRSAIDNIGVDNQADLLDIALDDQPGGRDSNGRSFADDVRSDSDQDERNERR